MIVPRPGERPEVFFGCMASLTSAPALSRIRTTSLRPSPHGEKQWREAGRQRGAVIGPGLQERLDDLDVALRRRPTSGPSDRDAPAH